jgi:6-phosphogluconate dehydrogenase
MIGIGRMGGNIVRRLMRDGHACVLYDRDPAAARALSTEGGAAALSVEELVAMLAPPRAVWVMLPAGSTTQAMVMTLGNLLDPGDIVIDGGNTFWKDDVDRARELAERGINYVDVGTSGGVWGLERGYCMMIGGNGPVIQHLDSLFASLAPGAGDIPRTPVGRIEIFELSEATSMPARPGPGTRQNDPQWN